MGNCIGKPEVKQEAAAKPPRILEKEVENFKVHDSALSASLRIKRHVDVPVKAISVSLPKPTTDRDRQKPVLAPQLSVGRLQGLSPEEIVEEYRRDANSLKDSISRIDELVRAKQTAGGSSQSPTHAHPSHGIATTAAEDPTPSQPEPEPTLEDLLAGDAQIALAREKYTNGRVLRAWRHVEEWCRAHSQTPADLEQHSGILGFKVSELKHQCDRVNESLRLLRDDTDFSVARDDGELRVLYKCIGKVHHIKMDAILPHPLERPLSLAREFDLMTTWNHYIVESQLLHAPTIWESTVYAGLWMPFPFPQMDCLGTGRGFDLSEEDKSLLVLMESIEESEMPEGALPLSKKTKKRHRAEAQQGSCIRLEALEPLPDGTPQTKGTILMMINPHVPHVPAFIVNFVLGVMAPFAHRQITKLLKDEFDDPSKPFPKRMAAQPELYDRVRTVVQEGLLQHYGIAARR